MVKSFSSVQRAFFLVSIGVILSNINQSVHCCNVAKQTQTQTLLDFMRSAEVQCLL